jgi:mannose-1-phosphate guanylyltransferase
VFQARLREGAALASEGALVTLGVVPTHPATGYGYIEVAEHKEHHKGHADFTHPSIGRPVKSFREKPDADTARRYLATGRYYWNAGLFILSIATLRQAVQAHAPQIDAIIRQGARYSHRHFEQMPDISMDYAILEKASNIMMLPLEAGWSDLGCWDNIYEMLAKDDDENAVQCRDFQHAGTRRSLVWSETGRHIATVGVEDLIVIDTPDALAIVRRGDSQSVKNLTLDRIAGPPGAVVSRIREQAAKTTEAPTQETADASP